METFIRNVGELDTNDRTALERVVGHKLRENQRIVIHVVGANVPSGVESPTASEALPDWCDVYAGLSEAEVDELDRGIVRSPSSRNVP